MRDENIAMPAILERWMPASVGTSVNERVRVAITMMVLIVNMALCLVSLLFVEFFLSRSITVELQYARVVVYPCAAVYLAAAFYLFYMKNYHVTRWLIVANILLSCYAGMMMTGGFTISPVTSLIVLPVMFSFLLMGVRAGILCALMMLCLFIPVSLMEIYGIYTPVQLIPSQFVWQSIALFVPLVGTALVVFSLVFYEMLTRRLQYALQEERNKFHWDATHDALTGLPNRPDFYQRLESAIRTVERNHQALALVIFDLDGFKPVNDNLGHHAGDMVLQTVGGRLHATVRGVDTVARIGGDEFAVILQDVSADAELLDLVLQKILKAVSDPVHVDGAVVSVSASLGVTFYRSGCTLHELCKQADIAMYVAKKTKNTWRLYFEDSAS